MDRPLTGEPLALDLVNTCWPQSDGEHDLLATVEGLAAWLDERGMSEVHASERVRGALIHARGVLRGVLEHVPGADAELNAVLARGLVVRAIEDGRAGERVVFTDDAWAPAWHAANDYLRLHEAGPQRIRQCEQPSCVLYFHDTTGRRRWCSMAGCGNRAKAQRHYARSRARREATDADRPV
jgi:predicted RNA-binding Zn ribbon-like protein